MTYNPTTPLSCDCAKTLIKSCALAYHPVVGCAYAVADLGLAGEVEVSIRLCLSVICQLLIVQTTDSL